MNTRGQATAIALAIAAAAYGCAPPTEQAAIKAATAALAKQDFAAATIELKTALSRNADSPQARFLLGKTLLELGDARGAEVELRKSQALKQPTDDWAPVLARSLLLRQQFAAVIDEFSAVSLKGPLAQADLSASVAAALIATGELDRGKALIESTLTASPNSAGMVMLKARVLAAPGTLDEAVALVDELLAREPKNAEAWQLRGDLLVFGKRDLAAARQAYTKVLDLRSNASAAHSMLVFTYLAGKDLPGATKQMAVMAKAIPGHPQTQYLQAQVQFLNGNAVRAKELVQQLLQRAPDNAALLVLAGAIELKLNALSQAEAYLGKALAQQRDLPAARRMLAESLLRSGKPAKALEALRPNLERTPADALSTMLAGQAHLQTGGLEKAEAMFRKASQLDPENPQYRTALALTQFSGGRAETAFTELRSIAASASSTLPDLSLISALIQRRQFDEALQAIDRLEQKEPDKPLAADLRGRVHLARNDQAAARASFEQALTKDPVYFPAVASLGAMDLGIGKTTPAIQRYESLLKADPQNTRALLAVAELKSRAGASADEISQWIEKAVKSAPSDPAPRLMSIQHLLSQRKLTAAMAAAQAGIAAMPDNADMMDAFGSVQLLSGDTNQAISTFSKIIAKQPESSKALLRLADAYLTNRDDPSAERTFKRVLELAPDIVSAQRGLIAISVRARNPDRALAVARTIQRQRPTKDVGYLLEGDIHVEFKNWDAGSKAYQAGLAKTDSIRLAERLYAALSASKKKSDAKRLAASWIQRHPEDTEFLMYLGNNSMNTSEFELAEDFYRETIKRNPTHASALNNLAWLMAKLKKADAVALAEKAVSLAPDNPALLDTLAYAHSSANQLEKAISTSRAVLKIAPNEPVYRLNLARFLIQSGDKAGAKVELQQLVPLGAKFARQQEVGELLKGL